jgi:HEAT repeat protein
VTDTAGSSGLFGRFAPFDERSADAFVGRAADTERLVALVTGEPRSVIVTGSSGVGKTSLLRAGMAPALGRRGFGVVTLGSYGDIERELVRATSLSGITPPVPGQDPADYLGFVSRESKQGMVLVLDHLEDVLGEGSAAAADVVGLLRRVREEGGPRLRLVLSIEESAFSRVEGVFAALGGRPEPRITVTVAPFDEATVTDILEKSAVQSGTPFQAGLAATVAGDLCKDGPCRGIDLQLVVRAIIDLRLGSMRRYRKSGGPTVVPALWMADVCRAAGGAIARRALLAACEPGGVTPAELGGASMIGGGRGRDRGPEVLAALRDRGLLQTSTRGRTEVFTLAHPALRERVREFAIADRARAVVARRALRRRIATGERLRVPELYGVFRHLRGTLTPPEQTAVRRSVRDAALRIGLGVSLVMLVMAGMFADSRRSYTLALDPADGAATSRVVVRLGRHRFRFLDFLPSTPKLGSIIADTGFSASGLGPETVSRIAGGRISATLDSAPGRGVPSWLREVLNGLRPVPRGIAKALLGDPEGIVALKQAFSDPAARTEILTVLAVIGRGGAGEDEILAGALADGSSEIRRRGVEVAAAIARRQVGAKQDGKASQAHAATLRTALADRSPDVRAAVLQEAPSLPPVEAAGIVTLALRDPDPILRRRAEDATNALAQRAPAAVVDALARLLESGDAGARRAALALFEPIAARAPAACAPVLVRVVLGDRVADDARVAALTILRRTGPPPASLRPALEKAVVPEASPRLRAAALPLYARLVSPAEAEEIARNEMKGPPAARAASAAVWAAVAVVRPDEAEKPLKAMLYDPAPEVRVEAARAYGALKRDGLDLVDKALKDPSVEVERAALESAQALAAQYPFQVADILGRAVKTVRPAVRRNLVEALARMGENRPAVALPPLAKAIKDSDTATRVAAANGFCALAKKNANAVASAPYLRIASRDDHDDVRLAAAACLGDVAAGDPKGAARMAAELAESGSAPVRIAAAQAVGNVGPDATAYALPTLLKLLGDSDAQVRVAAEQAFAAAVSRTPALDKKRAAEAEKALEGAVVQGDVAERKLIVDAAAKAGLWGLLRQATRDGDEDVRLAAVRAAGKAKGPGLEIVSGAVNDQSQTVRAEAMRLLAGGAGAGAREVLPTFEAMLHGGDRSAREAAAAGIGELVDPGEGGVRLLGEALSQRSESLRAAAARALGRLAARHPALVAPLLERAVHDPAYDVRDAALPGLAVAWSHRMTGSELGRMLATSDTDGMRRFVALEALVAVAQGRGAPAEKAAARAELDRIAESGPALARLAARIGQSFVSAPPGEMHAFVERLFGG